MEPRADVTAMPGKATSTRPHAIMFHHFSGGTHPRGQGAISADELREMIHFLGVDNIMPASEWMVWALQDNLSERHICLTFDDNLRCQFDIAYPVLREFGLTAFWFVYSSVLQGHLERLELFRAFRTNYFGDVDEFYRAFSAMIRETPMADDVDRALATFDPASYLVNFSFYSDNDRRFRFVRDEVIGPDHYNNVMDDLMSAMGVEPHFLARNLWMADPALKQLHAEGHIIGLHSHTHPTRLENLPPTEQEREYRANQKHLEGLLGHAPFAMSHPCNSYNADTLAILKSLGIRLGFRSNMAPGFESSLEFPRRDHADVLAEMRS